MAGPECGSTTPGAPKCFILFSFFLFLSSGLHLLEALPGNRPTGLTMQQPGKDKGYDELLGGLHYEHYICFIHHSAAYPWRGTCLIVPSLAYRTIRIILHSRQYFLNKQMQHLFASNCISFLYICSFMTCCIRTLWYG